MVTSLCTVAIYIVLASSYKAVAVTPSSVLSRLSIFNFTNIFDNALVGVIAVAAVTLVKLFD